MLDVANNGLAARVHRDVLDDDLLLPAVAIHRADLIVATCMAVARRSR